MSLNRVGKLAQGSTRVVTNAKGFKVKDNYFSTEKITEESQKEGLLNRSGGSKNQQNDHS